MASHAVNYNSPSVLYIYIDIGFSLIRTLYGVMRRVRAEIRSDFALTIASFPGFAAKELATRIDHAKPKVIVAASCGLEPSKVVR